MFHCHSFVFGGVIDWQPSCRPLQLVHAHAWCRKKRAWWSMPRWSSEAWWLVLRHLVPYASIFWMDVLVKHSFFQCNDLLSCPTETIPIFLCMFRGRKAVPHKLPRDSSSNRMKFLAKDAISENSKSWLKMTSRRGLHAGECWNFRVCEKMLIHPTVSSITTRDGWNRHF